MERIDSGKLFSMEGKNVIITGGAGGIGTSIANHMAASGANVAIFDVSQESAAAVATELMELYGRKAIAVSCDVTNPASIEAALDATEAALGVADTLVNNAGIGLVKFCLDVTPEDWMRVNNVNYNGMFYMATAFARRLVKIGKPGAIVNTASMSGAIVNLPQQQIAYNSSKAGVVHMTHTLAVELAPHNIRVNCVSPGYTQTIMTARHPQELRDNWTSRIPMNRMASPDELAPAYIYLASDQAGYTTGCNLAIDGGYTIV